MASIAGNTRAARIREMASKITMNSVVLHYGKRLKIEAILTRHLLANGGRLIPLSQCRHIK